LRSTRAFNPQVFSVPGQDVEAEEAWLGTVEQQDVELGISVRIQTDDLTMENDGTVW
jgi:hypothetical protein